METPDRPVQSCCACPAAAVRLCAKCGNPVCALHAALYETMEYLPVRRRVLRARCSPSCTPVKPIAGGGYSTR
jgi:hypothetical protein